MKSDPTISVLIPAFNEQSLLPSTLDSIHDSFAALDFPSYEILVCDNNSTDGTAAEAEAHGARVIHEPHNQIARARNAAARAARSDWLIFLDADTRMNPQVLTLTIDHLASGRVCGGGAAVCFDVEMRGLVGFLTKAWNWCSRRFAWAAGSYLFCLREAWQGAQGFDERLYASEEIGFSRRLARWGHRRGMAFVIISEASITTSSRKVTRYRPWQIVLHLLLLSLPGALRSRATTGFWYKPDR